MTIRVFYPKVGSMFRRGTAPFTSTHSAFLAANVDAPNYHGGLRRFTLRAQRGPITRSAETTVSQATAPHTEKYIRTLMFIATRPVAAYVKEHRTHVICMLHDKNTGLVLDAGSQSASL